MTQQRPFTPETLAMRWEVSATTIRNMCQAGELAHFRPGGRLYRIPAQEVERIEACQKSASEGCEAASAPIGALMENAHVISLRHAPERKQGQRR
ncbi:helix-turn-helix domain-containing protein [Yoonia sp. 72]|uniref:helix-turn-helix domain-containing protein n=1 Tax=unclassified Yoonia TaxID=2629118 RepID=UPI003A4C621F